MSTNHTANYDLCQWEATDQVLRTDFNQDNAKIDAALKAVETKCGLQTIWSHTSASDEEALQLPCNGIDWTNWKCVHLVIDPNMAGGGYSIDLLQPNGARQPFIDVISGPLHLMAWPMYRGDRNFCGTYMDQTLHQFLTERTYDSIYGLLLDLTSSYPFLPGSRFTLYGEQV